MSANESLAADSEIWGWSPGLNQAEVLQRTQRIGMMPLRLPRGYGVRPDTEAEINRSLVKFLGPSGVEVIPATEFTAIHQRLIREAGGIYDPRTGQVDSAKHQLLFERAYEEFVDIHDLDALVLAEIETRQAEFNGNVAFLDRVFEPTTGIPDRSMFGFEGKIPSLALRLSFHDTARRLLFSDLAGIQLTAYTGFCDFGGFRYVPRERLLKDPVRIERAVQLTTLWWRETEQEIKSDKAARKARERLQFDAVDRKDLLPPLPEALLPGSIDPFKRPREEVLARVKTVIIQPITLAGRTTEVSSRYEKLLSEQLEALGWHVVPPSKGREAFKAEKPSGGEFYDPNTGQRREDAAQALLQRILARVGKEQPIDAVLEASIVAASAPYEGQMVEWDGVRQDAFTIGPWERDEKPVQDVKCRRGAKDKGIMPALSLAVALRAAGDGALLYEDRGGIQVLQRGENEQYHPIPPSEWFTNPRNDEIAVHAALRALLLTPEQYAAELASAVTVPPPQED